MSSIISAAVRLVFLSFLPVFSASVFPYIRIRARGVVSGIVVFTMGGLGNILSGCFLYIRIWYSCMYT